MKPLLPLSRSAARQGMSKPSLILGLLLWIAVFVALIVVYRGRSADTEAENVQPGPSADEPVIVDVTDPKAKKSTPIISPPARELPEFKFENSEGGFFSTEDVKGKRWVASFVFSRCRSTCPLITGAMMELHDDVKGKADDVMFVTITVDPDHDTAEVFQEYAELYRKGDSSRWKFLTGSQQEIYELIVKGFGLYVAENLGADRMAGFEVAHTNRVVLVNEDTVPVGTFLGTNPEHMIKLRRILTGRDDFPEAGPELKTGDPKGEPEQVTFELVPVDKETGKPIREVDDSEDESPEGEDEKQSDESEPEESESELEESNKSAGVEFFDRTFVLTSAPIMQTEDSEDSAPGDSSSDTTEVADPTTPPATDVALKEQSVAEFNDALQAKLPAWAVQLPMVNAILNSIATVLLLVGYIAIRQKKKELHRNLMISAFLTSVIFLLCYLTYHYALGEYTGEHGRRFEGTGIWASIYPWVLWPHVILAVFVPVLALRVFFLAFKERWDEHRSLAKITFPIWLYVSVTGVVIYGMLYHWPA